jgi:predicted nucleic acid-binding Zn ribbon protein
MTKIGDILGAFFDSATLQKAKGYGKLFAPSAWETLTTTCGLAAAASHSRIATLERSVLQIETDHPGWIQLLQTKQKELLEQLQRHYPELNIQGIAFMLFRKAPPAPDSHGAA